MYCRILESFRWKETIEYGFATVAVLRDAEMGTAEIPALSEQSSPVRNQCIDFISYTPDKWRHSISV